MAVRIWLHEGWGGDPGSDAWGLDLLGFATWAPTKQELLNRVPAKLDEYLGWLSRHHLTIPDPGDGIEITGSVFSRDDVLFMPDRDPATVEEFDRTIQMLRSSRSDLLHTVELLPDKILDWDPPYREFASWADWRTIRATLAHLANTETHFYLKQIGYQPTARPVVPGDDWLSSLESSRGEAFRFLQRLKGSSDRARLSEFWSVRKVLRRMVRHELLHWKSIRRIVREYEATHPGRER